MPTLLITVTLLSLLCTKSVPSHAKPDRLGHFFQSCPPLACGPHQVRFPLRPQSAPSACGLPGLELTCSGNNTLLLSLPSFTPFKVTAINYSERSLTVAIGSGFGSLSSSCPLRNLTTFSFLKTAVFSPHYTLSISLVTCLQKFTPGPDSGMIAGPILCLSESGSFIYVVGESESMDVIPAGCMVVGTGGEIPYQVGGEYSLGMILSSFEEKREVSLRWDVGENSKICADCEGGGGLCGFDFGGNQSFCQISNHHGNFVYVLTKKTLDLF